MSSLYLGQAKEHDCHPYPLSSSYHQLMHKQSQMDRARILERNPGKSLKEFSSLLFSSFYNFALRFLFLQTHAASYVKLLHIVKKKGGKPDRKPYPLPYGLRNPYRNLKAETFKIISRNLNKTVLHEFGFRKGLAVWFNISANHVKLNPSRIQLTNHKTFLFNIFPNLLFVNSASDVFFRM